MDATNVTQLSALSRIFSPAVFLELARQGRSPTFARLFRLAQLEYTCPEQSTVGEAFNVAFKLLRQSASRAEYVYRAAVTHKVLLGRHSLNTACMLPEFRTGLCKADLVILNGTATVYEIKSERDSLTRLHKQIENYRKVFAAVNVIAGDNHISSVLESAPPDIGIMRLSSRYRIETIREGRITPELVCPVSIFESLRKSEALKVLESLGLDVPDVPNTHKHASMLEIFRGLDPAQVHRAMVQILKQSRNLSALKSFVDQLPASLQAAALSAKVKREEQIRVLNAMPTPLEDARLWA